MKRQYLPRLPSTEKIFHIPLGYTDKAAKSWMNESNPEGDRTARHYSHNQKITERKYKWSFCGQSSKQDRKLMLQCLKNCHPNFIFETDRTGQNKSLSGKDYWEIMTQSIFIPSPIGNINVDCYRLFESLEAGAIPIILKGTAYQPYDYYKNLLGHHPIPTFSSWRGVEIFLENINVASIQEISEKVSQWYKSYKLNLKIKIQEVMSKLSMGKLLSEDHHLITFINASQE